MKKISLIAALAVSTMLSACGGGGGGGHSFVPPATIPDTPGTDTPENKEKLTEMKARLVSDSNAFTQLVKATDGLDDVYDGVNTQQSIMLMSTMALTSSRANDKNICKSERDCNQQLFDNMVKILVDQDLENATPKEIREALLLAGFSKTELAGMWDDINGLKKFINEHPERIESGVDNIYNNYANLTMENAELHLAALHESEQDAKIQFTLDENDEIDGITLTQNSNKVDELSYTLARDGGENKFDIKTPIYRYGINSPYYSGIYIESLIDLPNEDIQNRLNKRVDELAKTGVFDDSGEREKEVQNLKDAIAIIYGGKDANDRSDMKVTQVTGDVREIDYNYQPGELIPIELFELNYTKTETTDYQSYAKEMKLAYSDFGLLNRTSDKKYINNNGETQTDTLTEKIVFAGGYKDKKIEAKDLAEKMTFEGRAVGGVNVLETDNHGDISNAVNKNLGLDGDATLVFDRDNGTQTVTAEFDNWYDVKAETDIDGKTGKLTLTNGDKIDDADFKFRGQDTYTVEDFTTAKQLLAEPKEPIDANSPGADQYLKDNGILDYYGNPEKHNDPAFGAMMIGYYGENKDPKEATGYVFYEEARGFNSEGLTQQEFVGKYGEGKIEDYYDRVRNTSVNFGFGAQRQ